MVDRAFQAELAPAHSLDAIAQLLARRKIAFTRGRGRITAALPRQQSDEINRLPQGEPIVFPADEGGFVACVLIPDPDSF